MREILFRGKTAKGEWVEGFYHQNLCGFHEIVTENKEKAFSVITYQVIPETVGQFTGLTDKHGKKIFEGDIVNWYGEILVVKFGEHDVIEQSYDVGNHFRNVDKFGWFGERQSCLSKGMDLILLKAGEVIGNIHDNPELLEKDNA